MTEHALIVVLIVLAILALLLYLRVRRSALHPVGR
jgi:hypothetical protein